MGGRCAGGGYWRSLLRHSLLQAPPAKAKEKTPRDTQRVVLVVFIRLSAVRRVAPPEVVIVLSSAPVLR